MIRTQDTETVLRVGVDLAKPGSESTVTFARMRINKHVRTWDLSMLVDLDVAMMRFRFDVLETEMHMEFDEMREQVLDEIRDKFLWLRSIRELNHELLMEQS